MDDDEPEATTDSTAPSSHKDSGEPVRDSGRSEDGISATRIPVGRYADESRRRESASSSSSRHDSMDLDPNETSEEHEPAERKAAGHRKPDEPFLLSQMASVASAAADAADATTAVASRRSPQPKNE